MSKTQVKGIIFSTPMVKQIQDDKKTQTRRVIPYDINDAFDWSDNPKLLADGSYEFVVPTLVGSADSPDHDIDYVTYKPRYAVGDVLYVKEPFIPRDKLAWDLQQWCERNGFKGDYVYQADVDQSEQMKGWRSPHYMPKAAVRIWLEVTAVKVERVRDISEADAKAEGADGMVNPGIPTAGASYRCGFSHLWDSLHAKPKPVYEKVNGIRQIAHYISYPWEDIQETREHRGKDWYVRGCPWVAAYTIRRIVNPLADAGGDAMQSAALPVLAPA